jgi:hypothetical protein
MIYTSYQILLEQWNQGGFNGLEIQLGWGDTKQNFGGDLLESGNLKGWNGDETLVLRQILKRWVVKTEGGWKCSGLCTTAGFGISNVQHLDSAIKD